jgi:hypothetical protein
LFEADARAKMLIYLLENKLVWRPTCHDHFFAGFMLGRGMDAEVVSSFLQKPNEKFREFRHYRFALALLDCWAFI